MDMIEKNDPFCGWDQLVMSQIWISMVPTFKNYMEFGRRSSNLRQFNFEDPQKAVWKLQDFPQQKMIKVEDHEWSWVFEREVGTYLTKEHYER